MVLGIASADEVRRWSEWMEFSEENRRTAMQATSELVGFEFTLAETPDIDKQWLRLRNETVGKKEKPASSTWKKEKRLKWIIRAVAIFLILGSAGIATVIFHNEDNSVPQLELLAEERIISTEADQHKTLQFSNGSRIVLNSSSTLTYRTGTTERPTIEVVLDGEAWFEADPNAESEQPAFEIVTPDGIIRDIGTKFLVSVQNGLSRVVLQEGVVEVEPLGRVEANEGTFRVRKGEMVEFRGTDIIARKEVNPSFYSSWATGVLVLAQSRMQEFAEYVEERFDVRVQLNQADLEGLQLNGTVYYRSLDELMRSVSEVIGIPVYRSADRDTVYIGM